MSLAGLETAVVEYVGDRLVNDVGRPVPDRLVRYHGPLPHDCCTDNGFLAIHWTDGRANAGGVGSSAADRDDPCVQRPFVTLVVRYVICWPDPPTVQGVPAPDDVYFATVDQKAAMLADVEDGITRALVGLGCGLHSGVGLDPYMLAVAAQSVRRSVRFVDAAPIVPLGKCAGVQWRLHVGPLPGPVS
jgi:hypothetical protein